MIYKDIQAVADMMNDATEREAAYEAACKSWQEKAGSRGIIAESNEDLEDVEVIDPSSLGFNKQDCCNGEEDCYDYDEDCMKKSSSVEQSSKEKEEGYKHNSTIAEADYEESLNEKVDLEECGFMLEDDNDVLHTDDEMCTITVEVTKEDDFAQNAFKKLVEEKFPVEINMMLDDDKCQVFGIHGKLGDVKEAYAYYVGKKSWNEVVDTDDEDQFYSMLVFADNDTFEEAQYRESVAKMIDDGEEQIDEADDREPISHGLDIVGVKASTADLTGQDEVEMTVVEKLQKRVDELERKLLKGSCGPMNEGEDEDDSEEDNEKLSPGWVKCCKCGAKLNKQIDTYRFTADGEPICYDCAEEDPDNEDADDKELDEHVKAVLEQDEDINEDTAAGAVLGGICGAAVGHKLEDTDECDVNEEEEEMMSADEFFGQMSEADDEDKVTQDEALQDMLDVAKTAKEIADKEEAGEQLEPEEKNYLKFAEDFCDCKLDIAYLKKTPLDQIQKKVKDSFIKLSRSGFAPSNVHLTGFHMPDKENNGSTKDEIYLNTSIDTDLGAHEKQWDKKRREKEAQKHAKNTIPLPKRGNKHWNWGDFSQVISKLDPEEAETLYYEMIRDAQASGNPKEEGLVKMMFGKKVHSANTVGGTALEYSDDDGKHSNRAAQSMYEKRLLDKLESILMTLSGKYPQVQRLLDLYNKLWAMRKQPEEEFLSKLDIYRQSGLIKSGEKPTRKGVFDAGIKMIFTKLGNMPNQISYKFMEEWLKSTPRKSWSDVWKPYYDEIHARWKAKQDALDIIARVSAVIRKKQNDTNDVRATTAEI